MMEIVYRRCCGLDVHKDTVTACVSIRESGKGQKEIRTFHTMTSDLPVLHDWLTAYGITHVAMESTSIYWKPICNLLGGEFPGAVGQCGPYLDGAGAKDRCEGL